MQTARAAPRRGRGLTLIEIVVALAVLAVLGMLALPGFGARADRERLAGAAEALVADINEARYEAARQGRAMHVAAQASPAWCWSVATTPDCPCGSGQACELRSAREHDHPGVRVAAAGRVTLTADGRAETTGSGFELGSARGQRLQVRVGPLGRAQVCSPQGGHPRHPSCP